MSTNVHYFAANTSNMIRIVLCLCVLRAAAVIVTESPRSGEYNYWYNIANPTTGDAKSHKEIRWGGVVRGSYSLIDPDGSKRTVDYTADPKSGFKAAVRTEAVLSPYVSLMPYSQFNSQHQDVSPTEFDQTPFTTTNFVQETPVLFTPGNNTVSERYVYNQEELFVPNYMHH